MASVESSQKQLLDRNWTMKFSGDQWFSPGFRVADHRDMELGGELIGRQAVRRRKNRRELLLYRAFPAALGKLATK
jgi:hypothetical protein